MANYIQNDELLRLISPQLDLSVMDRTIENHFLEDRPDSAIKLLQSYGLDEVDFEKSKGFNKAKLFNIFRQEIWKLTLWKDF